MPLSAGGRACVNCGDPVPGTDDLCSDCRPAEHANAGIALATCPYCGTTTTWEKMRRYRRNHESGRVEVLYYCPACRGILESASWMER